MWTGGTLSNGAPGRKQMADPITKETLRELFRLMDSWGPFPRSDKPLVAEEDEDGIVHLSDADTGAPRMHMPREVFDELRAWKPRPVWRDEDPRHVINKWGIIAIVRPKAPGIDWVRACVAMVDTKHTYTVQTGFEKPYHWLDVDADWPEGWKWTWAPEGT